MNYFKEQVKFFDKKEEKRLGEYQALDIEWFRKEIFSDRKLYDMDRFGKDEGLTRKFWWQKYVKQFSKKKMLDIGCGVSYHLFYWASNDNYVVGLDPSIKSLQINRMLLEKLNLHAYLIMGCGEKIPVKETFDVIHLNNTLHHVESALDTLKEARSLCKETGVLVMVEPNYYWPFRWIAHTDFLKKINIVKKYFIRKGIMPEHDRSYSYKFILRTLREAGFSAVNIDYDINLLGYTLYFKLKPNSFLGKILYLFDKYLFSRIIPPKFSPFIYIIAKPV